MAGKGFPKKLAFQKDRPFPAKLWTGPAAGLEELLAMWKLKWRVLFAPDKMESQERALAEAKELKIPGAGKWLLQHPSQTPASRFPTIKTTTQKDGAMKATRPPFELVPPTPPSVPKPPYEGTR